MKRVLYLVLVLSCLTNYAYHASFLLHDDPLLQPSWYHMVNLSDELFLVHMQVNEHNTGSYRVYPFYSTIIRSGYYCLANAVSGIVTIAANDVTLDLSGNTVTGGIVVSSGQKNITIKNGTVSATGSDGILVNSGCSTIALNGVSIQNAARGINFNQVSDSIAESCSLIQNTTGLLINNSSNLVIKNCQAVRNNSAGFSLNLSTTCAILNCQALSTGDGNTAATNNNVYGFISQNGFGNIFQNCIANSTQALLTTDFNSIIAGFALTGNEQCSRIVNSEACNAATRVTGSTIPYGIYLQNTISSVVTLTAVPFIPTPTVGSDSLTHSWSPDGQYIAVGSSETSPRIRIYYFNRTMNVATQVATPNIVPNNIIKSIQWSPNGMYIAVGENAGGAGPRLSVYSFDSVNNTLTRVSVPNVFPAGGPVVAWSPNMQYIAAGSTVASPRILLYGFDKVALTLKLLATDSSSANNIGDLAWRPDGQYFAAVALATTNRLYIYSFDPVSSTLTVATSIAIGAAGNSVAWSSDGVYIAVGSPAALRIYSFNSGTNTLTLLEAFTSGLSGAIQSVAWSADGRYLISGSAAAPFLNIFYFSRSSNTLSQVATPNIATTTAINSVAWDPAGGFMSAATDASNPLVIYMYTALTFPSNNVIKNNTVSCNSGGGGGVGISGSSIANLIIQNTAYDNPRNPRSVFTNYNFVCNVYKQLFGVAPTYLQNKEVNNVILQQQDVDTTVQIIESKLSSIQRQVTSLLVFA